MTSDALDAYLSSPSLERIFLGETGPLPDDRRWLDGPGLAVWIRQNHSNVEAQLGKNLHRRVQAWKAGSPASEEAADRVLIRLGSQLVDLPGELWIAKPKRRARRRPEEMPERVAA